MKTYILRETQTVEPQKSNLHSPPPRPAPGLTALVERLLAHRERLSRLHAQDQQADAPGVWLPEGLERKYPKAEQEWGWPRKSLRSTRFLN
jgi:hypothetical protein